MSLRLLLGVLALLSTPGWAADDVAGSVDLEGLERFPRAWIVAFERNEEFAPREFVISAVEKIRRELRIEHKLRVEATKLGITYQMPAGTPLAEVIGHYQQALGPQALFSCRGRDCGRSNGWANQVFGQAVLYGPEANQFYIAADRGAGLVAVYVIERGNKRIYAHVEALQPRRGRGRHPKHQLGGGLGWQGLRRHRWRASAHGWHHSQRRAGGAGGFGAAAGQL